MTLPNFLCVGAQKCGTTTLYDILKNHPDIYLSEFKEPHYFDLNKNYNHGLQWYETEFFNKYSNEAAIGDFTPTYLPSNTAPKRILDSLGKNIKLIFLLRNPVDRAYSQYLHIVRHGLENEDFKNALILEDTRLKQYLAEDNQASFIYHSYIRQSLYFKHIKKFLELFDRSNMFFAIFEEDLLQNKQEMVFDMLNFLNVKNIPLDLAIHSNPSAVSRSHWLRKMLNNKDSILRQFALILIKNKRTQKKINLKLNSLLIKPKQPQKLSDQDRTYIYHTYFKKDVDKLEKLLTRNLDIWKCE